MFMLKSTHQAILQALDLGWAKGEVALRTLLQTRETQLSETKEALAQALAKIERMELALMPLSTAAGAVYQANLHPHQTRPQSNLVPARERPETWREYLNRHVEELEKEDALTPAQKAALKEEKHHGVQSE